jgi:protoporphyrinogen oxidase
LKVLIIGGGLSGLGAGYKLSQKGFEVTVLEKREYVGGMAASYFIDGYYVPKTYHHIMSGDTVTLGLIKELGLQPYLYWKKLKTAFLYGKDRYNFSSPISILRFKPLSFMDRLKFGLLVWKARRKKDWAFLDGVNVKDWVSENYGDSLYEDLIKHIVIDKFDEAPENISVAWLLSRFGHESKSVSGNFGYLRDGGIQRIIDGLVEKIRENGGEVKTQADVKKIEVENGKAVGVVHGEDQEFLEGDIVISTIPTPILLEITPEFPKTFKERLEKITYKACICITLGLKEKVSEYYWLNIIGDYPFVGVFEHRHLNIDSSTKGITYVVKYLDTSHLDWTLSDEDLIERYMDKLEEIFPGVKEKILWFHIYREPFSTPVYLVNFGKYMPDIRSPIKNLYITGISRIYPKDRYMGTALGSGFEAAETVTQDYKTL